MDKKLTGKVRGRAALPMGLDRGLAGLVSVAVPGILWAKSQGLLEAQPSSAEDVAGSGSQLPRDGVPAHAEHAVVAAATVGDEASAGAPTVQAEAAASTEDETTAAQAPAPGLTEEHTQPQAPERPEDLPADLEAQAASGASAPVAEADKKAADAGSAKEEAWLQTNEGLLCLHVNITMFNIL